MAGPLNITLQDVMKAFERAVGENAQLKLVNVVLETRLEVVESELARLKESVNGKSETRVRDEIQSTQKENSGEGKGA